jgi:hypothetical protein
MSIPLPPGVTFAVEDQPDRAEVEALPDGLDAFNIAA